VQQHDRIALTSAQIVQPHTIVISESALGNLLRQST
jgi:hypothetical protein